MYSIMPFGRSKYLFADKKLSFQELLEDIYEGNLDVCVTCKVALLNSKFGIYFYKNYLFSLGEVNKKQFFK